MQSRCAELKKRCLIPAGGDRRPPYAASPLGLENHAAPMGRATAAPSLNTARRRPITHYAPGRRSGGFFERSSPIEPNASASTTHASTTHQVAEEIARSGGAGEDGRDVLVVATSIATFVHACGRTKDPEQLRQAARRPSALEHRYARYKVRQAYAKAYGGKVDGPAADRLAAALLRKTAEAPLDVVEAVYLEVANPAE